MLKPHASYVLTIEKLKTFYERMGAIKLLTNYGSSLAKYVAHRKLGSMKSHDYHTLIKKTVTFVLMTIHDSGATNDYYEV
jgi:hypothetical protein